MELTNLGFNDETLTSDRGTREMTGWKHSPWLGDFGHRLSVS